MVFTKYFRPYLLGKRFILRTDHGSLQWLFNFKDPEGQVARWLEALQEMDFEIIHRKGHSHNNADALSRIPCRQCGQFPEESPVLQDTSVGATAITNQGSLDLKQIQQEDPVLKPIIHAKLNNTAPPQGGQSRESLLQMLATCADSHPFEWEDHINKVCMAYNTSIHASSGYSPFFFMFGRKADLPIDVIYDTPADVSTLPVFVQKLQQTLKEAYASAHLNTSIHQERQRDTYNIRAHGSPHQPGSLVWLFNSKVPKGRAKKLHKPWSGPYKVIKRFSDNTYRIKNTQRPFTTKVVHFDRLKPCIPGTRLPQHLHSNVQFTRNDGSQTAAD